MSNIDQINEGDLVEAVKGKQRVTDVAAASEYQEGALYLPVIRGRWYLTQLEELGWTLTVIEKAAPPLPTEPGHYLDRDGDHWELPSDVGLDPEYAPYTRLEPVPDTVKRVVDYLRDLDCNGTAADIEEHFGVTS